MSSLRSQAPPLHRNHDSGRPQTLFHAPPPFTERSVPEMSSPMASISDCRRLRIRLSICEPYQRAGQGHQENTEPKDQRWNNRFFGSNTETGKREYQNALVLQVRGKSGRS